MSRQVQKYHPDHEISSGQRMIRSDGERFDKYFPKADTRDKVVFEDGEVDDTIKMIERVVWTYIKDTQRIAPILAKANTEDTLRAIWEFLFYNIQYKLDEEGLEQLRRPARAWADRISGIDCDCFSIFCSSILCNLGIAHSFRITKYSKAHWQHIYVIVPKHNSTGYWTVDAVLGQFNYEKPFTQKMDYTMSLNGINIAVLSGIAAEDGDATMPSTIVASNNDYVQLDGGIVMNQDQLAAVQNKALHATLFAHDLQGLGLLDGEQSMLGAISNSDLEDGLYKYLLATRQAIAENPATASVAGYNQQDILKMLDYAIHYWYSDKREMALGQLMLNEQYLNELNGLGALGNILSDDELYGDDDILFGDEEEEGLGKAKKAKPAKAAKKVAKAAKPKAKQKGFFKKIGNGLKKVGKGIVRFNPASIAARNGFLLALRTNIGKMAEKLKWAYATPQQAQAKGVNPNTINKAKNALAKIEKLFTKIGGKPANLRKAILKAKKGRLNGLGAAPAAAAIAAATPIIVAAINAMKSSGLVAPNENVDISTTGDDQGVSYESSPAEVNSEENDAVEVSEEPESEAMEGLGSLGTGIIQFTQNNPMLGIAIGGTIAYGIYQLMNQSSGTKTSTSTKTLSGTGKKRLHHFQLK